MTELESKKKIIEVLETTQITDDFYLIACERIWREAIKPFVDDIKAGYEEKIFESRRKHIPNH